MNYKKKIIEKAIEILGGYEIEGVRLKGEGRWGGKNIYKAWEGMALEIMNGEEDDKAEIAGLINESWERIVSDRRVFIMVEEIGNVVASPLRQGFLQAMRVFTEFLPSMPIDRSVTIHYANEPDGYIGTVSIGGKKERVRINARELLMKRNLIDRVMEVLEILEIDLSNPDWILFKESLQWWCKKNANKFLIAGGNRCLWCKGCLAKEAEL